MCFILFLFFCPPHCLVRFSLLMQLMLKVAYVCRHMHSVCDSVLMTFIAVVVMHWEQCFVVSLNVA